MQNWEYLQADAIMIQGNWKGKVEENEYPNVKEMLSELGKDGWEMISAIDTVQEKYIDRLEHEKFLTIAIRYYFKRKIE